MKIHCLSAFTDNYMWLLEMDKNIVVVDPGEAAPIIHYLREHQLHLKAVLLTHDHHDHVGGLEELLHYAKAPVYGHCRFADYSDNHFFLSDKINVQVLDTPGHTDKSVCYLIQTQASQHLFCGDTLFASGCGRVFTGDYSAMFYSLNQLKALSPDCLVYPGHEYTLKNLHFAQFIEPNNPLIEARLKEESDKWRLQNNTLPVTMDIEQKTNPFFRCEEPTLVEAVSEKIGRPVESGLDCFIQLRGLRDVF